MFRVVSILCFGLWAAALVGAESPQKYALLIAVTKYDHAEMNKPEPLKYPEADAISFGDLLKEGGYEVELLLGKSAIQDAVRQKIAAVSRKANSDGIVLVGLFGYGVEIESRDKNGEKVQEGCYCPFDTGLRVVKDSQGDDVVGQDQQALVEVDPATVFKLSELVTALRLAKAGHRVAIVDCCRSNPKFARGPTTGASFRSLDLPENTAVLFSCSPNEKVFEHQNWGHGAFTKCLLDELRELSSSGAIDTSRLAATLKKKVPQLVATAFPGNVQIPKLFSTDSIDLQLSVEDPDYLQGMAFLWGLGVKIDESRAVVHLLKAAGREHPLAMGLVARCYQFGQRLPQDTEEAARWADRSRPRIEKLAAANNPRAQLILGAIYNFGIGVRPDPVEGTKWLRRAADQNDPIAQNDLGVMYTLGFGVEKNQVEAVRLFHKAAEQNLAAAQGILGQLYAIGDGVPKDPAEAIKWFRKAADQNLANAQYSLGVIFANGDEVARDPVEALKWLRQSAKQNHAEAQYFLGYMLANSDGTGKDLAEAANWFRKAADQNLANAQNRLGQMLALGNGVPKNPNEAVKWLTKAADQNHLEALYFLGKMYASGESIPQDAGEAVKWFRKGADQNDPKAQYELGMMYALGDGVKQDKAEVAKWWRKAADQNHATAQLMLGMMYANGDGVTKDSTKAEKWLRKSINNPEATDKSKKLATELMKKLGKSL